MSSQGDKLVYLQPGQKGLPVRAAGDFVFLKSAEREVRVIIDGQPVVMRSGDKRRVNRSEPGRLAFDSFEVDNSSDTLPLQCVFVVGEGDYDSQIIRGEIKAVPGVRRASGEFVSDTTYRLGLSMVLDAGFSPQVYEKFDQSEIELPGVDNSPGVGLSASGNLMFPIRWDGGLTRMFYGEYSDDGVFLGEFTLATTLGGYLGTPSLKRFTYFDGGLYFMGTTSKSAVKLVGSDSGVDVIDDDADFDLRDLSYDAKAGVLYRVVRELGVENFLLQSFDVDDSYALLESVDLVGLVGFRPDGMHVENGICTVFSSLGAGPLAQFRIEDKHILFNEAGWFTGGESALVSVGKWWVTGDNGRGFVRAAAEDFTVSTRGYSRIAKDSAQVLRIFKQSLTDANLSFADVKYTATSEGRILSGEVVRAALELYFGKEVGDSYLDHVFEFTAHSGVSPVIIPELLTTKVVGESFAAAGIPDDFKVHDPGWLELVIDKDLPFVE